MPISIGYSNIVSSDQPSTREQQSRRSLSRDEARCLVSSVTVTARVTLRYRTAGSKIGGFVGTPDSARTPFRLSSRASRSRISTVPGNAMATSSQDDEVATAVDAGMDSRSLCFSFCS